MTEYTITRRREALKVGEALGVHPVDVSLQTLQGIIEYAVGQHVTLGVPYGSGNRLGEHFTGAVMSRATFLAYGNEGTNVVWEFGIHDLKLEQLDPHAVYVEGFLRNRQKYVDVDQAEFSRILVADSEIEPLGGFARDMVTSLLNIPSYTIAESGIDLANVGASQAARIIDAVRSQYSDGNWRQTVQLAFATGHIGNFIRMAREQTARDMRNTKMTVADDHIGSVIQKEYRTDVDLLLTCALKRGIQELRGQGRLQAAEHAQAWVSQIEKGLSLDSFPPEVTLEQILRYPSYLNPRPDKGVPVISSMAYLAGGTGSRNHTIKYPDGSIYAVDFPDHGYGARPILGQEEKGYSGNINDGTVRGFVHIDERWLDFEDVVARHVARDLVEEIVHKAGSFKENTLTYEEILREAVIVVDGRKLGLSETQSKEIQSQLAALLMASRCMQYTEGILGRATGLYDFSVTGWGNKTDIESRVGIGLTSFQSSLGEAAKHAYDAFGAALRGYEIALLAESYQKNPEFSEHIRQYRTDHHLTQSSDFYYARIQEAIRSLLGKGEMAALLSTIVQDAEALFLRRLSNKHGR